MTPVDQRIMHDPNNGVYGDCMRACVASLLDLNIENVPHFFESGNPSEFNATLAAFLKSQGLAELNVRWRDMFDHDYVFRGVKGVYHLIAGRTKGGAWHAVVGKDGRMVHDPHPKRLGVLEPVYYSFFIKYSGD